MTEHDYEPFVQRLNHLGETLDAPLSAERIAGYVDALRDLALEDLLVAMGRAARECEFFPKPVELRTFAREARDARRQTELDAHLRNLPAPGPPTPEERAATEAAFQAFQTKAREVLRGMAWPGERTER